MKNQSLKATLLSSLGAGFEYYDFIMYGMMAEFLSVLFFTSDAPWLRALQTFAIFAVGYFARPFGGIFFGMLGDTFGRKKIFLYSSFLMSVATLAIGVIPSYQSIGAIASISLLFLRICQGLSFGAELPGAITVACEYAEEKKEAGNASIVIASTSVGAMLASFILYILSEATSKGQILSWGWRIPFLLSGVFGLANFAIRKYLQETPKFLQAKESNCIAKDFKEPFKILIKHYRLQIFQGIGITSLFASSVMITLYFPMYLKTYFSYSSSDIYLTMLLSLIFSALVLPISGRLVDYYGKREFLKKVALAVAIGAFPLYSMLKFETFNMLLLFMVAYQLILAFASVSSLSLLVEVFPTPVRYTGVAACYNLSFSLMALLPLVLTALIQLTGSPLSVLWVVAACAVLTYISLYLSEKWVVALHET